MNSTHIEIKNEAAQRRRYRLIMTGMALLLFGVVLLSFYVGYYPLSPSQVILAFLSKLGYLNGRNLLREQIMREVFGRKVSHQWTGRWFYSLFNVLFLMGYDPETSYENRHQEILVTPDEEYVEFIMEHMLPTEEHSRENAKKILNWLKTHVNEDGLIAEITDSSYGRILWDVRRKTERPDYRSMEQGV